MGGFLSDCGIWYNTDMKLSLNKEFALRHLFVALLMAALGGWFGYDGYVTYPSMTARDLYVRCHKGEQPADDLAAEKFSATAIPRQKQFMFLCLLAAAVIGGHVLIVSRLDFSFDADGFTYRGRYIPFLDVQSVDDAQWEKKGIVRLVASSCSLTLDSWHHAGVKEFHARLDEVLKSGRNGGMADAADLKSAGR